MSFATVILFILLVLVVCFKPTYVVLRAETEEGELGFIFGRTWLFRALIAKAEYREDILILSTREYNECLEFYNELRANRQDTSLL